MAVVSKLVLAIALTGCHDAATDDAVTCTGPNPTFPTFDKTCERADECAIAFHMVSCCGSQVAIGISNIEQARFTADEARCEAQYPPCGCPPQPTQAEDGRTTTDNSQIVVQCTPARQCTTSVP